MPIPSISDVENFGIDIEDCAEFINSKDIIFNTRTGGPKKTVTGIIAESVSGNVTDYNSLSVYSDITDWVKYNDVIYRPIPSYLPIGPESFNSGHWIVAQVPVEQETYTADDYSEMISNHAIEPYPEGAVITVTNDDLAGDFKVVYSPSHGIVYTKGLTITLDSNHYAQRINFNEVVVDWFLTDGTRVNDSIAIRSAIYKAEGYPVKFRNKRYYYDGTTITFANIRLHGSGMPNVNSGYTALENGTIIDGSFTFIANNMEVIDLGVDVGSASDCDNGDSLRISATTLNGGGHLHTENIIALNKNSTTNHAILTQSFQKHTGGNLYGIYSLFGFVSKCQNVDLSTISTYKNDESGVILKSDTGFGRCRNVSIQKISCICSDDQRRGFHIQSSDDNLRNVQIDQISSDGAQENVLIQIGSNGTDLRNITINDIYSKNSQTKDFGVENLNGVASIFNINIGRIITENTTTYGIRTSGNGDTDDLSIESAFISHVPAATQAQMDDSCFIGGNTKKTRIDDLTIIRNYSKLVIGGITYSDGENGDHILGSMWGNIFGVNRPQCGYSEIDITGTGNSVTVPKNEKGESFSVIRFAPTEAATQINEFAVPVAGANNFQFGYKLTLMNNSIYSSTVLHNPNSGIYNAGGLSVTIPSNEVRTWVYGGNDTWFQSN